MKKILAIVIMIIFASTLVVGCSDGVSIEKDPEITEFPHVTEDGHVLYKLSIDDKEINTKHYPFRYTAEALLKQKQKIYEDKEKKETSTEETTTSKNSTKSTTKKTNTNNKSTEGLNPNSKQKTTTKAANNATKETETTTIKYIDLIEKDEFCTYFPITEVLDFYDIKYVEDDDHETITTEINNVVLYLKADKTTMYVGNDVAKITPMVVYEDCLYATPNIFKYFLQLDSGLTFDKTTATLNKPVEVETTSSAAQTCPYCKGLGTIKCPECGGDGIDGQYEILYNEDTNANWNNPAPNERRCTHCDGSGWVICEDCDGYGVVPTAKYTIDKYLSVEEESTDEGEGKDSKETTTQKK